MKIQVKFFGPAAEKAGCVHFIVESEGTIGTVVEKVLHEFPELKTFGSAMKYARNTDYATLDTQLEEGDTLSFLPPVGGG
jgi:molybdopterin converting factor small subunit|tara:strand:+ start:304 stop:543 length:240 start_codon:yes stop_codon:yes gene_type:complete